MNPMCASSLEDVGVLLEPPPHTVNMCCKSFCFVTCLVHLREEDHILLLFSSWTQQAAATVELPDYIHWIDTAFIDMAVVWKAANVDASQGFTSIIEAFYSFTYGCFRLVFVVVTKMAAITTSSFYQLALTNKASSLISQYHSRSPPIQTKSGVLFSV